jgi:hypothetical protein
MSKGGNGQDPFTRPDGDVVVGVPRDSSHRCIQVPDSTQPQRHSGRGLHVPLVAEIVAADAVPSPAGDVAGVDVGLAVLRRGRADRALPAGNPDVRLLLRSHNYLPRLQMLRPSWSRREHGRLSP